ncbi:MAG TPA: TonB family protein [Roseiarcus sp.]|nr:TonB family protein [Roseiarcus sp.]
MSAVGADWAFESTPAPALEFEASPRWLRPATILVIVALHAVALYGFACYRVPPPPALETLDLTLVAEGDDAPETTKDVQAHQAPPPDPTPDPVVEEKRPEPEPPEPPPPPDRMAFDPLPPDTPPPPDKMDFDPSPAPPDPPSPVLKEAADAIDLPLPPPPAPPPPPPPPTAKPVETPPVPPPPKPKPKPKPRPPLANAQKAPNDQPASEAHRVGVREGQAQDVGLSRATYAAMLLAQIGARKYYPEAAREHGVTGAVVVSFSVGAGGGMGAVTVIQSSGSAELDNAARQIVRSVAAPPPPGGEFSASTTIRFHIN